MIISPFTKSLGLYLQYNQVNKVHKSFFWQVRADHTGNNSKKENEHSIEAHFSVALIKITKYIQMRYDNNNKIIIR